MTRDKAALGIKTPPMEALLVAELPQGKAWRYELKWDGFRCLAFKQDAKIDLVSKSGKPLNRYFPDIVALLEQVKAAQFVLDGELVIEKDEGYSFGDLQLRLHLSALAAGQGAAAMYDGTVRPVNAEFIRPWKNTSLMYCITQMPRLRKSGRGAHFLSQSGFAQIQSKESP